MLGGVAAGLAEHFAVDVAIVRIVLVVFALLTNGVGALAYLVAVLVIPAGDEPGTASGGTPGTSAPSASAGAPSARDGDANPRDASFWVGIGLLVVAGGMLVSGPLAPHRLLGGFLRADVVVALMLIAFGFALWRVGDRRVPATTSAPSPPTPHVPARAATVPFVTPTETIMATSSSRPPDDTPATEDAATGTSADDTSPDDVPAGDADADTKVIDTASGGDGGAPPPPETARAQEDWGFTPPPIGSRTRSILGRATVGVALMTVGVVWLLDSLGAVNVSGVQLLATGLLVVGLGLILGAFFGRARSLIVVGMLLVPIVLAAALFRPYTGMTFADGLIRDGAGDVTEAPAAASDVRQEYALATGRFVIDLSDLDLSTFDTEPVVIVAEMGAGELTVRLPDDVTATIDARLGVGGLRILDRSYGWIGAQHSTTVTVGEGTHAIELDVRLGVGQLTITAPSGATTTESNR